MQYKISDLIFRKTIPELCVSGIYKIEANDGRLYIGSTVKTIRKRWTTHKYYLNNNIHHSLYLQNIFNKHGIDYLSFSVVEVVEDKAKIIEREQYWIDTLKPVLNMLKTAGHCIGSVKSETQKSEISNRLRAKSIAENKGVRYSEKTNSYQATICINNKTLTFNTFYKYEDALEHRNYIQNILWADAFKLLSSEEKENVIKRLKTEEPKGCIKRKPTNTGHMYIKLTKNNTFNFYHHKTKHSRNFKTLDEAIQYKDLHLQEFNNRS